MKNKDIFYDIYSEFYNVNKFRELKNVIEGAFNVITSDKIQMENLLELSLWNI